MQPLIKQNIFGNLTEFLKYIISAASPTPEILHIALLMQLPGIRLCNAQYLVQ